MNIIDQHTHTYFSHDSKEKFEVYLNNTKTDIVTTEHSDFSNVKYNDKDTLLDYKSYVAEIERLNRLYDNRIRKGIEIGYSRSDVDKTNSYLKDKEFDIILLSVHHNGIFDYMYEDLEVEELYKNINDYFKLLAEGLRKINRVNVLAHIDFVLRRKNYCLERLMEENKTILIEIAKLIIEKNIALELNTRSMYEHNNLDFYNLFIDIYLDLGGDMFTLASDAHKLNKFKFKFPQAIEFMKSKGINHIVEFKKEKPYIVKLEDQTK